MRPNLRVIHSESSPALAEGERLISEYVGQADIVDSTKHRHTVQLTEFLVWLSHPKSARGDAPTSLLAVRRADVVRFMGYLKTGDRYAAPQDPRRSSALSASTRKNFLAAIRSLYRYLCSVELVEHDPSNTVPRPKVPIKPGMHLTADELRRLLAVDGSPRDRIQVYLLAFTGARVSELRFLRWRDVSLEEGTLSFHGKGNKWRVVYIHPRLMPEIRRWKLRQDALAERRPELAEARQDPDTDWVLVTTRGKQLPTAAIYKQLKRRASRAGLYVLEPGHREHRSEVTPHTLRRTFATILLNGGEHLDAVADVLGHSYVDTTRKHYAFASDARKKATIDAFKI